MKTSCPSVEELRTAASWIRDELDPVIAREGPEVMHPNDALNLNELLHDLQHCQYTVNQIRYSRIHYAIIGIAGKATRWPSRLADVCDRIVAAWEEQFGCRLRELKAPLHDYGGRLYGVCAVADITEDDLLARWHKETPDLQPDDGAFASGHLGFKPGSWWINGLFAYHAGVIDWESVYGGICADSTRAYAIVMTGSDQLPTDSPERFTYRCDAQDPGRFRLTAATEDSRVPIRVFTLHTLQSPWSPRAGLRYDGLYRVSGWRLVPCDAAKNGGSFFRWEVHLQREENQTSMEEVVRHPLADEVDDYVEYKRLRSAYREQRRRRPAAGKQPHVSEPSLLSEANDIFRDIRPLVSTGLDGHGSLPINLPAQGRMDSQALTPSQNFQTFKDDVQSLGNGSSSCIAEHCYTCQNCDRIPGGFKERQWPNNLRQDPVVTPVIRLNEDASMQPPRAPISQEATSQKSSSQDATPQESVERESTIALAEAMLSSTLITLNNRSSTSKQHNAKISLVPSVALVGPSRAAAAVPSIARSRIFRRGAARPVSNEFDRSNAPPKVFRKDFAFPSSMPASSGPLVYSPIPLLALGRRPNDSPPPLSLETPAAQCT